MCWGDHGKQDSWNWELSHKWKYTDNQWDHIRSLLGLEQWNPPQVGIERKNNWQMTKYIFDEWKFECIFIDTDMNASTCSRVHSGHGWDILRHPVQFELTSSKVTDLKPLPIATHHSGRQRGRNVHLVLWLHLQFWKFSKWSELWWDQRGEWYKDIAFSSGRGWGEKRFHESKGFWKIICSYNMLVCSEPNS